MISRGRGATRRGQRRAVDAFDAAEAKRLQGALVAARPERLPEVAPLVSHELGAGDMRQGAEEVAQRVGRLHSEAARRPEPRALPR